MMGACFLLCPKWSYESSVDNWLTGGEELDDDDDDDDQDEGTPDRRALVLGWWSADHCRKKD